MFRFNHFEEEEINSNDWAMSWLRYLLSVELPLECVLRLWDTYLSAQLGLDLHVFVCLAILINFSEELLELEHSEILGFLQHLPGIDMDQNRILLFDLNLLTRFKNCNMMSSPIIQNNNNNNSSSGGSNNSENNSGKKNNNLSFCISSFENALKNVTTGTVCSPPSTSGGLPPIPTIPTFNGKSPLSDDVILDYQCPEDIDQLQKEVMNIWPTFYRLLSVKRDNIFRSVVDLLSHALGGDRRYIISQLNENQSTLIPLYDSKIFIDKPTTATNNPDHPITSAINSSNCNTNTNGSSKINLTTFSPIFLEPIPITGNKDGVPSPSEIPCSDILHQIKDEHSVIYNEKESVLQIPLFFKFILGAITIKPFYKHELDILSSSQLIRFVKIKAIKEMERIKSESLLNFFVEFSCTDSNELFHSLTKYLCYYLGVKHAFVCQFIPPDTSISISYCKEGVIQPNIEYLLSGTPCGELTAKKPVHFANNIVSYFPEDKWLVENNIVSYLGIPFLDSVGDMLGHLTVMNDREINPDIMYTSILAALANKTTMELERRKVAENFAVTKELLNQFPSTSVILTNGEGKISRTFGAQLFDFQSTELIDQSIDILQYNQNSQDMPLSQMIPVNCNADGTTKPNEGIKKEVVCSKNPKEQFPAEVYVKNINIHKDKFIGRMYVIRDITETKNNQRVLVEARDRALQGVQMKSQFMASISHEIRTPMNAVIGLSEILLSSNLPQVQMNVVETLHKSAELLYSITSDILDFQRIEASKLELEIIEFDFQGCIEGIVNTLSLQLDKPIEILLSFDNKIPKILKGDPNRIRQILLNLGQNSIKYTNYGHIYIKISLLEHNDFKCKISFSIEDTGIGMEESQHSKLFQPFHQLDSSTTRNHLHVALNVGRSPPTLPGATGSLSDGTTTLETTETLQDYSGVEYCQDSRGWRRQFKLLPTRVLQRAKPTVWCYQFVGSVFVFECTRKAFHQPDGCRRN
ncbi:hypothetical protein PPL_03019 [Heterostelium album PN500]|uniref:histidine kinase n=1 Tax=Heterostelium pallidum (strain ATCC 26659 / Pp 5 / PN500) TaxID=670386 RepID=D3B3Q1_HETP5|nr:hypothetical protein PPL_03019 [Heterostelium album PN500]EFA83949.1 hypothetical protein PPL_03019 [Heterostelium album PN500]|eukprot:XP_020436066.1 hypothetical protein PPL_03019 [Heterostelium album PN500]